MPSPRDSVFGFQVPEGGRHGRNRIDIADAPATALTPEGTPKVDGASLEGALRDFIENGCDRHAPMVGTCRLTAYIDGDVDAAMRRFCAEHRTSRRALLAVALSALKDAIETVEAC